jgi:hypothetical protein
MYNTRTVAGDKQQKEQYNKEYKIHVRSEIDNRGAREDSFTLKQQPSTSYAAKLKDVITSSMSTIVDRTCCFYFISRVQLLNVEVIPSLNH